MTRKLKYLFIIISIFALTSNLFADETKYWNISIVSGKPEKYKFKQYRGPYNSKDEAIANWIYEDIPFDKEYAITFFNLDDKNKIINQKLVTGNPSNTYRDIYNGINKEFDADRYNTMNKYKIVPISSIEKKFTKKTKVYSKKIHPREYAFDIYDISKEIFLKYENKMAFSCEINFTQLCLNDLPQKGDTVTIYYDGKTNNFIQTLDMVLFDSTGRIASQSILSNLEKNERFSGAVSFKIDKNVKNSIYIKLINNKKDERFKIDQTLLQFKRVVESTDTVKEAEEEKYAIQNKIEIVEVKNTLIEEELKKQEEEKERLEAEKQAELLKQKQEEEEKAKELERQLALQKEIDKKQQDELEKALEQAAKKSSVSRYQREYLQDYEPETVYNGKKSAKKSNTVLIENPDETDASGKTLLMKAAKSGNDWQIKTLLESGADINLKDKDGWTALMYAVRYQENLTAVSLLLNNGADVYIENNFRTTALTIATCYNNNPEILKLLLKHYESSNKDVLKSLTMLFVSSQPSEFIQLAKLDVFIQKAIPINTFYEGKTPLMYACQYGNSTEVIQILLNNNAAVTLRSSEGKTAFDYASKNSNLQHDDTYWSLNRKK